VHRETSCADDLKLEMSPDKTLITHAGTDKARFLGYEITTWEKRKAAAVDPTQVAPWGQWRHQADDPRQGGGGTQRACTRRRADRPPKHSHKYDDDFSIIATYGIVYRGYVQYYKARPPTSVGFGHPALGDVLVIAQDAGSDPQGLRPPPCDGSISAVHGVARRQPQAGPEGPPSRGPMAGRST